jgi:hypothetical protein
MNCSAVVSVAPINYTTTAHNIPTRESNCRSANEEIARLLLDLKLRYCVHNSPVQVECY